MKLISQLPKIKFNQLPNDILNIIYKMAQEEERKEIEIIRNNDPYENKMLMGSKHKYCFILINTIKNEYDKKKRRLNFHKFYLRNWSRCFNIMMMKKVETELINFFL